MAVLQIKFRSIISSLVLVLLALTLVYVAIGLGYHFMWEDALGDCREEKMARGEFVEPEVFGNILGMAFDAIYWPVYVQANMVHDGTPFATPCTK